jgi:hypothetical protein
VTTDTPTPPHPQPEEDPISADTGKPRPRPAPPIETLDAYFEAAKGDELPRRLLRSMRDQDRTSFSREELDRALALLPSADPDLRRVRSLVRASRQRFDGDFERAALDFARAAIAPMLTRTAFQEVDRPAAERFAEVVADQSLALHDKQTARRALNVMLLALDILADAGLSMEDAIPALRRAVASERDQPPNPRRERLAQLAAPGITIEQLRRTLSLSEPWERMAADARHGTESAERAEALERQERENAEARVIERQAEIERLERTLQAAQREVELVRNQLRDAGSLGRSDVVAVRARARAFLQGRLRPSLETAREAAENDPPNARVIRRMILDALHEVDKELQWLISLA